MLVAENPPEWSHADGRRQTCQHLRPWPRGIALSTGSIRANALIARANDIKRTTIGHYDSGAVGTRSCPQHGHLSGYDSAFLRCSCPVTAGLAHPQPAVGAGA